MERKRKRERVLGGREINKFYLFIVNIYKKMYSSKNECMNE